ncbi:MAG TPA: DUF2231 domain-containing protein [Rhizomicrobium sp.]|jgi:uncharacterized membrane protein|nr:DUF2231 domain-containing protein [Rhizomicrobium sp.]
MNPRSRIQIAGHPIHVMLVPFVIGYYMGAFGSDIAYAATHDSFWARAAFWLIGAGIIVSVFAGTIGFIDFLAEPKIRALSAAWWHLGANLAMSGVSIADLCLRFETGAEGGSHDYLWLSGVAVLLLLFSGWQGGQMVYRYRVGVST